MTKHIDRHVQEERQSFTLLVPISHLKTIKSIAKDEDRTKGHVVRLAIAEFLEGRKK